MSSARKILLLFAQIFLFAVCLAQKERIGSLKRILPSLHDSARVDCLNELSEVYLGLPDWFSEKPTNIQFDSAEIFSGQAFEEATRLSYGYGLARAISLRAEILFERYNNYSETEKLSREAIIYYQASQNKKGLNRTYWRLGTALYSTSNFQSAINALDTSYYLSAQAQDSFYAFCALVVSANVYDDRGDCVRGFDKAWTLHQQIGLDTNSQWRAWETEILGNIYTYIEDYQTATKYYRQSLQGLPVYDDLTLSFAHLQQFDSAEKYFKLDVPDTSDERGLQFHLAFLGEYYLLTRSPKKALPNLLRSLRYSRYYSDANQIMRALVDIAQAYLDLQKEDSAFKYAREAMDWSKRTGNKIIIRDAFKIISSIYDSRGGADSAYTYYKQYKQMSDSVVNDQIRGKLAGYSYEQKIESLDRERKIQQMQLQRQSLLKDVLICSIIFLFVLGGIIVRNVALKRRNERLKLKHELDLQKLESDKQLSELEMQALRAQMNPHFIFNSLNSINRFILQNDRAQASEYLTKFSKLVRMILQNSQASLISLESELESLRLYLEMEALRFNYHFKYKISVQPDLDLETLRVPPLIIQPYVENAIWHGIMHKEEEGHLDIEVSGENNALLIRVSDDGIGRKRAAELESKSATKHKSMGLRITADRIAMMHNSNGKESPVIIHDLVNADGTAAGTEIIIKTPLVYD